MSTILEIEDAIKHLSAGERETLEARLLARRFGLDALGEAERAELLESLRRQFLRSGFSLKVRWWKHR